MKNKFRTSTCMVVCLYAFITSCDIINPDEPNPTTIHLNPFEFHIQQGQGTANNRISEVWVFANGNNLGAYTPPTDIFFLEEGPTQISFYPGIRNNGISNDAIIYPMFTADTFIIDASPGSYHEINPETRYRSQVTFSFLSDFELGNDFVDNRDTLTASNLVQSQTDVFEGSYSGEIIMSSEAHFIEVAHGIAISGLPVDGKSAYLEMRYKNETPFWIGLLGLDLSGNKFPNFFYLVKPTEEWNMLYLELTDVLEASSFSAYKVIFQATYPSDATAPQLHIFLDNIKVVHL